MESRDVSHACAHGDLSSAESARKSCTASHRSTGYGRHGAGTTDIRSTRYGRTAVRYTGELQYGTRETRSRGPQNQFMQYLPTRFQLLPQFIDQPAAVLTKSPCLLPFYYNTDIQTRVVTALHREFDQASTLLRLRCRYSSDKSHSLGTFGTRSSRQMTLLNRLASPNSIGPLNGHTDRCTPAKLHGRLRDDMKIQG